jgi:putative phosphoesterase
MILAFISDVHANLEAFDSVMRDIESRDVDQIYCLGDIVGYGPDPEEVTRRIMKIQSIAGNYDDAVGYSKSSCGCSYKPGRETEVGDISLNWTIENTSQEIKNYLKSLKHRMELEFDGVKFLLVHGSPLDELLEYVTPDTEPERLRKIIENVEADVIISGHTHLPMAKFFKGKLILNAGSVGRPKDGNPKACYLLIYIHEGVLSYEFIRVSYDVKKTCEKIAMKKLPAELSVVLTLGKSYDMGKPLSETSFILP